MFFHTKNSIYVKYTKSRATTNGFIPSQALLQMVLAQNLSYFRVRAAACSQTAVPHRRTLPREGIVTSTADANGLWFFTSCFSPSDRDTSEMFDRSVRISTLREGRGILLVLPACTYAAMAIPHRQGAGTRVHRRKRSFC